jgi:hypothetical protein
MTNPTLASPTPHTPRSGLRTFVRLVFGAAALLLVLTAVVFALWWMVGAPHESISVIIDEDSITIPGSAGGEWLLALGGLLLALLVVLVVVPLALLVGLGVPAVLTVFGLAIGLLCLGVAIAVLCSPVLLPVLLVWWLVRRDRRPVPPASTTIAA